MAQEGNIWRHSRRTYIKDIGGHWEGHRRTSKRTQEDTWLVCEDGGCSAALVARGGGGGGWGRPWHLFQSQWKGPRAVSSPNTLWTIISKNPENMASHLSHAYTYRLPEEQQSAVEISLRFPRISSFRFKLFFNFPTVDLWNLRKKTWESSISVMFQMVSETLLPCLGWIGSLSGRHLGDLL